MINRCRNDYIWSFGITGTNKTGEKYPEFVTSKLFVQIKYDLKGNIIDIVLLFVTYKIW